MPAKKILIATTLCISLPILAFGGWLAYSFLGNLNAPVYALQQRLSSDGRFMETFLTNGDIRYIQTSLEFALAPDGSHLFRRLIGKQDAQKVYEVPGNDGYVVLSGFMFPDTVFRNESAAPIDFATIQLREIIVFGDQPGSSSSRNTQDEAVLGELLQQLQKEAAPLPGKPLNTSQIRLYSNDLPGLYFFLYITTFPDGSVYFSFPTDMEQGIPAGPIFTQWIMNR
jgi:hypothetical protein